jgi:hypothetical protein
MELKAAIERLMNAVNQGTNASAGAVTVLLFGWNSEHPIRGLMSLDTMNGKAALTVIDAALSRRLNGGIVISDVVGHDTMLELAPRYGANGTAWER